MISVRFDTNSMTFPDGAWKAMGYIICGKAHRSNGDSNGPEGFAGQYSMVGLFSSTVRKSKSRLRVLPPIIMTVPLCNVKTVGYQRADVMSGSRDHLPTAVPCGVNCRRPFLPLRTYSTLSGPTIDWLSPPMTMTDPSAI